VACLGACESVVVMEPRVEMARVAVFAAIGLCQKVVKEEFPKAVPSGPVE